MHQKKDEEYMNHFKRLMVLSRGLGTGKWKKGYYKEERKKEEVNVSKVVFLFV